MMTMATTEPDSGITGQVSEWLAATRGVDLFPGADVDASLFRTRGLLKHLEVTGRLDLELTEQDTAADSLHAACRILFLDCSEDPKGVLSKCAVIHEALDGCAWPNDELEERTDLLCSLSFVAWRAARLLADSCEGQRWEATYRRLFRGSLQWQALEVLLSLEETNASDSTSLSPRVSPEGHFQTLIYLQDHVAAKPQEIAEKARELYQTLQTETGWPSDIQSYLLGASARLAGAALRHNEQRAATDWLDIAEAHFRGGPDPAPELARVLFTRLSVAYNDRSDLVLPVIPMLDATFARFEMDEDRVKNRILWSMALKDAGRIEEALDVLRPLRDARSRIRPALYAYVLREYGDLYQICGDYKQGFAELGEAARLLRETNQLIGLPSIIGMIGFGYRAQGMLSEAVKFFTESQRCYVQLGMMPYAAYSGLFVAETLLAMERSKEAELVLLSVLPTIESEGMIANAVAAINLLREAIRQQKLDPEMLRELRERLRPGGK